MFATILGLLSLSIWIGLLLFYDGFWLRRKRDDRSVPSFDRWPDVVAVVSARNEADVIDNCNLGMVIKIKGKIGLSLTNRSLSIQPHLSFREIGDMITRSGYAQLQYSFLLLALTLAGMSLVYLVPPILFFLTYGLSVWVGLAGWAMMALVFQPILYFYHHSPLWGIALPLIAIFYSCATVFLSYMSGRGEVECGRGVRKHV